MITSLKLFSQVEPNGSFYPWRHCLPAELSSLACLLPFSHSGGVWAAFLQNSLPPMSPQKQRQSYITTGYSFLSWSSMCILTLFTLASKSISCSTITNYQNPWWFQYPHRPSTLGMCTCAINRITTKKHHIMCICVPRVCKGISFFGGEMLLSVDKTGPPSVYILGIIRQHVYYISSHHFEELGSRQRTLFTHFRTSLALIVCSIHI